MAQSPPTSSDSRGGLLHWMYVPVRGIGKLFFRTSDTDLERKLQYLSKEEVTVHARLKRRTVGWRKLARVMVIYSVVMEAGVLGFAILSTRSELLSAQARALRVLPVFVLPALAFLVYSVCARLHKMGEDRDHKTLKRLQAERKAKIDELKRKTNYYATQQLIQRYDTDPEAKAAAAQALVQQLGAEVGLQVQTRPIEDSSKPTTPRAGARAGSRPTTPRSGTQGGADDAEGLRRRKVTGKGLEGQQGAIIQAEGLVPVTASEAPDPWNAEYTEGLHAGVSWEGSGFGPAGQYVRPRHASQQSQHLGVRPAGADGGQESSREPRQGTAGSWVARLAAMLVGEDPTQCYALICERCHMHNGLARKEDFPYITYYCPRCNHLNKAEHYQPPAEGSQSAPRTPRGHPSVSREADFHVHEGELTTGVSQAVQQSLTNQLLAGRFGGSAELRSAVALEDLAGQAAPLRSDPPPQAINGS